MKLPEKLKHTTETSSGASPYETRETINEIIDYLAEMERQSTYTNSGLVHVDFKNMKHGTIIKPQRTQNLRPINSERE